jgi:Protein of unknown function (DUF2946)
MDDIVVAAMARWPNVPAVYGWLGLTARGEWRIRGEPIGNAALREFIGRNYASDQRGNWYFQNGPQRVYVALEATPFVYNLDAVGRLQAHTGARPRSLRSAYADEDGRLYLETELGIGLIASEDLPRCAERVVDANGVLLDEAQLARWADGNATAYFDPDGLLEEESRPVKIAHVERARLPETFSFVARPAT